MSQPKTPRAARNTLPVLTLGAALLAGGTAAAQDADGMLNCVSLTQVDHTEVVDDNTILFYMRNNDIYRNVLPHRCPGLGREQTFMYRVSTSQLCNVDVITVMDRVGAGFMQGASCGLGKFQPVNSEQVDALRAALQP